MSKRSMECGVIRRWLGATVVALAVLTAGQAAADDESADLPSRVGRVSDVAGELFLATREGVNEWAPIGLNYPITSGDNLWVSGNGRAEIDFGTGLLRLAGNTNLQVTTLDDRQFALFVASGGVIVRIRALEPGEAARIETPHTQIDIDRPGQYRIGVDADRERTTLAVREGEAGIRFASGVQQTLSGQVATVIGADGAGLAIQNGVGGDAFDTWSAARDQRYQLARGLTYVSPGMVGARDLDDYGTWETTPTYGPVWYPTTVAVGWAPYRFGNWTWVAPWGWAWVDAAPWGYAPSHYGRWIWTGRWGWCPGTRVARPAWAPALVGWYGGPGWSNAGAPVYGWVPLGWGEPYLPSWGRCSNRCWRQFNQPYAVAQVDRLLSAPSRYVNAMVPGAMTAVTAPVLRGQRPVAPNQVSVGGSVGATAPILATAPPVPPQPGHGLQRRLPATPIPAGAQYGIRGRSEVGAAPPAPVAAPVIAGPAQTSPPVAASPPEASSRAAATPVLTPPNGGRIVAAPPARTLPVNVRSIQPVPSSAAAQMYGGVPVARGAYTGVAPTPGPKAPLTIDRGIALSQTVQSFPQRVVPVAAPPQTAAPASPPHQGATHDASAHPTTVPTGAVPDSAAAGMRGTLGPSFAK